MINLLVFPVIAGSCFLLLTVGLAIRNIYFHPLSYLPGPKLWIAFPFLRHLTAIRGLLDSSMCQFHDKYGQIVRFGPDEVSFINAQAWKDIYQRQPEQLQRHIVPAFRYPYDIFCANDADHTRFRRVMSPAFSAKALQAQEPLLRGYIDNLIRVLGDVAQSGSPTNMVKWYNLTTFDIIGDLAFGQSFGGLKTREYHFVIEYLFKSYKWLTYLEAATAYPVFYSIVMRLLPNSVKEAGAKRLAHADATVTKRIEDKSLHGRGDFMDSMTKNEGTKDGLTRTELVANANNLIVAGSETTATLLSGLTYYLVNNRDALSRATAEVRSAFEDDSQITFTTATAKLPYLLACINEAFRMYPPVPTGLQRLAPPDAPVTISGCVIPAKTKVSVHNLAASYSATNFYRPDLYRPERWLHDSKSSPSSLYYHDNRDVVQPFSVGPRNCIGQNLAYNEMRVIMARVLWNFDLESANTDGWRDQKSWFLWEKGPLMCRVTKRVD